jgi:uncharacterized protein (TIGR03663 family)
MCSTPRTLAAIVLVTEDSPLGLIPRVLKTDNLAGMPSDRPRTWWTGVTYVATLAMFLRFYDLPLKPLPHDEGVNTLFVSRLVHPPHAYAYDPSNYHGPTLFYFGWLSVSVLGVNAVGIRGVTAAAGLALVFLVAALRTNLGARGALAAAAVLASSSGAVYYARYFIHETVLVCSTLAAVVGVLLWWSRRRSIYLYAAAAAIGIMFATKETAVISAVVIVGAAIGSAVLADLAPIAQAKRFLASLRERGGMKVVAAAALVAIAVAMVFYTSFLTYPAGAIAAVKTFAIWTKTGTSAHTQPWYTYLRWLMIEEGPLLTIAAAGIAGALVRRSDRFASFVALWAIGIVTAYSVIPYKTPWLVLNMILPLALCAGVALERIWSLPVRAARVLGWTVLVVVVSAGTARAAWLSFWHYDDERSAYVYAHTSRELLKLVSVVNRVQSAHPHTAITVMSRHYFPLPWYFRDYPTGWHGRVVPTQSPIVVAAVEQQRELDGQLGAAYDRHGPYLLRSGVRLLLYVRRDLRPSDPGS